MVSSSPYPDHGSRAPRSDDSRDRTRRGCDAVLRADHMPTPRQRQRRATGALANDTTPHDIRQRRTSGTDPTLARYCPRVLGLVCLLLVGWWVAVPTSGRLQLGKNETTDLIKNRDWSKLQAEFLPTLTSVTCNNIYGIIWNAALRSWQIHRLNSVALHIGRISYARLMYATDISAGGNPALEINWS